MGTLVMRLSDRAMTFAGWLACETIDHRRNAQDCGQASTTKHSVQDKS
jgi:hypothetical protein